MSALSSLVPVLITVLPIFGSSFLSLAAKRGSSVRSGVVNLISLATFILATWQFILVQNGHILEYKLTWILGPGLYWKVDFISATFAVIVSLVWFLVGVYAEEYMQYEQKQTRFFIASIFTLGSTLGVFLAGDLFTLFLFFELMTFAAYLLVIHGESAEALQAGNVYLFMSVIGGLFLLGAIFFIQDVLGHTQFTPSLAEFVTAGINPWLLFGVVILGFGVKAGMLPLHIWLPKAHPVAPAPASALLSALMIKTGAYGFLRFCYVIFDPLENLNLVIWQEKFGYAFIWFGAITMLIGALMALLHSPMKRILAYSSISQMGYILFSLGVGVMLGPAGAVGFAGAWMHMINHAFFKSFLFILAGVVYLQTGELDLNQLGGLRKQMPFTLLFFLIAAAGITGVPGFNGYVSKVLIHEGILEAFYAKGWPSLLWLERVFVFTGGLTAAYISKIWLKTFFGTAKKDWSKISDLSPTHAGVFTVYAFILLGIGLTAQSRITQFVLPALGITTFNTGSIAHLQHVPFWDPHELQGPLLSYAIALGVLLLQALVGGRFQVPAWLSVEFLVYRPIYLGSKGLINLLNQFARHGQTVLKQLPAWPNLPKFDLKWSPLTWAKGKTSLIFDSLILLIICLLLLGLFILR